MASVTFALQLLTGDDVEEVPERALEDSLDGHRELIERQDPIEAAVVIEATGQPRLEIVDALPAIAQNLCFSAVARLADQAGDCVAYRHWSDDDTLVLVPLGGPRGAVRLIGEDTPTVTVRTEELLPALYDCGMRMLGLLERLGGDGPATAEFLRAAAERAREALARWQA
jgi:hypothetical protein